MRKIPDICPECKHSVKFWHDSKGHVATVDCQELVQLRERVETAEHHLGTLLAVMLGDGGHRQADVGDEQAAEEAQAKYYALIGRAEAAEALNAELRAALEGARQKLWGAQSRDHLAEFKAWAARIGKSRVPDYTPFGMFSAGWSAALSTFDSFVPDAPILARTPEDELKQREQAVSPRYVEHVLCSECGKHVSGHDPELGLVVRAYVACPECVVQADATGGEAALKQRQAEQALIAAARDLITTSVSPVPPNIYMDGSRGKLGRASQPGEIWEALRDALAAIDATGGETDV